MDILLGKNIEGEVELAPVVSHQNNHKAKDLDININDDVSEVKDNDFV